MHATITQRIEKPCCRDNSQSGSEPRERKPIFPSPCHLTPHMIIAFSILPTLKLYIGETRGVPTLILNEYLTTYSDLGILRSRKTSRVYRCGVLECLIMVPAEKVALHTCYFIYWPHLTLLTRFVTHGPTAIYDHTYIEF